MIRQLTCILPPSSPCSPPFPLSRASSLSLARSNSSTDRVERSQFVQCMCNFVCITCCCCSDRSEVFCTLARQAIHPVRVYSADPARIVTRLTLTTRALLILTNERLMSQEKHKVYCLLFSSSRLIIHEHSIYSKQTKTYRVGSSKEISQNLHSWSNATSLYSAWLLQLLKNAALQIQDLSNSLSPKLSFEISFKLLSSFLSSFLSSLLSYLLSFLNLS